MSGGVHEQKIQRHFPALARAPPITAPVAMAVLQHCIRREMGKCSDGSTYNSQQAVVRASLLEGYEI